MSDLLTNLNSIYNTKLQIKEALGTDSDVFADYPSYISAISPSGTSYVTSNGLYNIASYEMVNVNVPQGGGETIAQKNAAWQTKWAPALAQVAAGLYAQDPSYGKPQITAPSGWCVQTALDGNAAMSELIAMDSLWIEIYGGYNYGQSMLHEQYVQIFTQMGLTIDSEGYLVSTDDDKILPFDADEAIVSNWYGVVGMGCFGGKKISSLNGGVVNSKWDYYGTVFNGSGFEYVYLDQFDYVVNQMLMLDKMHEDGVNFINGIPVVNQSTLYNYLADFQMDGTVNPSGSLLITSNNTYDVIDKASVVVNVPSSGGGGTSYIFTDISNSSDYYTIGAYYEMSGEIHDNGTISAEDCESIGISTDYAGYHVYYLTKRTILYTDEPAIATIFFLSQNSVSLPGNEIDNVILRGTFLEYVSAMGANLFILNELAGLCNVGGNSSYTITENRTADFYDVSAYAYVYVDVQASASGTYNISNNGTYDISPYAYVDVSVAGGVPLNVVELTDISTQTNNVSAAGKINKTYNYFVGIDGTMNSSICYISNLEDLGLSHNKPYIFTGDYYPNGYMVGQPELYVTSFKLI